MKIPYQTLVEQISDIAIVVLDAQGNIRSWNAGAQFLTGHTEQEVLGRPITSFLQDDLAEKAMKVGRTSTQGWLKQKNGQPLWTENVVQVIRTEHETTLCWMFRDPFGTSRSADAVQTSAPCLRAVS